MRSGGDADLASTLLGDVSSNNLPVNSAVQVVPLCQGNVTNGCGDYHPEQIGYRITVSSVPITEADAPVIVRIPTFVGYRAFEPENFPNVPTFSNIGLAATISAYLDLSRDDPSAPINEGTPNDTVTLTPSLATGNAYCGLFPSVDNYVAGSLSNVRSIPGTTYTGTILAGSVVDLDERSESVIGSITPYFLEPANEFREYSILYSYINFTEDKYGNDSGPVAWYLVYYQGAFGWFWSGLSSLDFGAGGASCFPELEGIDEYLQPINLATAPRVEINESNYNQVLAPDPRDLVPPFGTCEGRARPGVDENGNQIVEADIVDRVDNEIRARCSYEVYESLFLQYTIVQGEPFTMRNFMAIVFQYEFGTAVTKSEPANNVLDDGAEELVAEAGARNLDQVCADYLPDVNSSDPGITCNMEGIIEFLRAIQGFYDRADTDVLEIVAPPERLSSSDFNEFADAALGTAAWSNGNIPTRPFNWGNWGSTEGPQGFDYISDQIEQHAPGSTFAVSTENNGFDENGMFYAQITDQEIDTPETRCAYAIVKDGLQSILGETTVCPN